MHTVRHGMWRKKVKNLENEKWTLHVEHRIW